MSTDTPRGFEPICESCGKAPASVVVEIRGEEFDVCGRCRPHGVGVTSRPIR